MTISDCFGFGAAVMTLAAFASTEVRSIRVNAIAANLLFIAYGALAISLPVLILHLMLLPMNLFQLSKLDSPDH